MMEQYSRKVTRRFVGWLAGSVSVASGRGPFDINEKDKIYKSNSLQQ